MAYILEDGVVWASISYPLTIYTFLQFHPLPIFPQTFFSVGEYQTQPPKRFDSPWVAKISPKCFPTQLDVDSSL